MTFARATRWSLIVAPVLAGVLLLILGTAGSISTAFGITLIGVGAIVWMWNWFIRMAFTEEAEKQATRERRAQEPEPPRQMPDPSDREQRDRDPRVHPQQHPQAPAPQHRPRQLGGRSRRRPH